MRGEYSRWNRNSSFGLLTTVAVLGFQRLGSRFLTSWFFMEGAAPTHRSGIPGD